VDNFRSGRFEAELLSLPFLVRVSAVVVAELARGARSRRERRFVDQLARGFSLVLWPAITVTYSSRGFMQQGGQARA
jgi:hypothetical protein